VLGVAFSPDAHTVATSGDDTSVSRSAGHRSSLGRTRPHTRLDVMPGCAPEQDGLPAKPSRGTHPRRDFPMSVQSPRQLDEQWMKSFNGADMDALLALYEPEATLIPQPGSPVTGYEAIREALSQFIGLGGQIDLRPSVVVESAGLALVMSDWTLTGGTDPDGNPVELSGRSTEVLRRQDDGSWLFVIDDPWSKG
jgi:ketosteroid isomerase-like protein